VTILFFLTIYDDSIALEYRRECRRGLLQRNPIGASHPLDLDVPKARPESSLDLSEDYLLHVIAIVQLHVKKFECSCAIPSHRFDHMPIGFLADTFFMNWVFKNVVFLDNYETYQK